MTFSIIIPAHNAEGRLGRMLSSIRRQTFLDYEIVVVCDKCVDNTKQVALGYGCRVFECDYGNSGMARNVGLDNAVGDWIMFADDDDQWINDYALEQLRAEIACCPQVPDVIQCPFVFGWLGVTAVGNRRVNANVWSKVWRRESIGDTRFPNVYPDDDLQFINLMLAKGLGVIFMPILWYDYNYMRKGSITWKEEMKKQGQPIA